LAAAEFRTTTWLSATATTYALTGIVSVIPDLDKAGSSPAFLTSLLGYALIVAGVLTPVLRLPSRP
jgi:hypothetical protein